MTKENFSYKFNVEKSYIQQLLNRFHAGELQIFDEIVKIYTPRLFAIAQTILNSPLDAEDVLQESFIRAYHALSSFRQEAALGTWLCRIVINSAKNRLHKNLREANFSRKINIDNDLANISDPIYSKKCDSCERLIDCRNCYAILLKEIDKLPPSTHAAIKLRFLKNLSYREISLRLNCSEGTVKSRISRGRILLQKRLKKYK